MPKLTLVMERKPVRVYDLNSLVISIGRTEDMQIMIDNVSVSRRQAQIRLEDSGVWTVKDLGSTNGTFLNGQRLTTSHSLTRGDEISFGKFALFFDSDIPSVVVDRAAIPPNHRAEEQTSTFYMKAEDVDELRRAVARKRHAQLQWEAGEARGTYYLDGEAALIGRSSRCDLRVPAGPKEHLLVTRTRQRFEIRNLSWWRRLRVNGEVVRRSALKTGDTIAIGGLRLTFADAFAPATPQGAPPAEPAVSRIA
jgi:pSer/pThr/pTyr-binding forkhead associated (FHA) protein